MRLVVVDNLKEGVIIGPNDPLYDLQSKYNVKIVRSDIGHADYTFRSRAAYIFRNKNKFVVRVGNNIPDSQKHLWDFTVNVITENDIVTYREVERAIKMFINRF